MSDVLISIQPKWCELILSGKKTVEVRKSFPMVNVGEEWRAIPFKCFVYCTKGKPDQYGTYCHFYDAKEGPVIGERGQIQNVFTSGMVIAEFMCRNMELFDSAQSEWAYAVAPRDIPCKMPMHEETALKIMTEKACLTYEDITAYFGDEDYKAYFWYISDLKIYEEPKPLTSFHRPCPEGLYCESCAMHNEHPVPHCGNYALEIRRAPQSWCYAEDQT